MRVIHLVVNQTTRAQDSPSSPESVRASLSFLELGDSHSFFGFALLNQRIQTSPHSTHLVHAIASRLEDFKFGSQRAIPPHRRRRTLSKEAAVSLPRPVGTAPTSVKINPCSEDKKWCHRILLRNLLRKWKLLTQNCQTTQGNQRHH